jgi:DNA polymerase-3 subunit delta'
MTTEERGRMVDDGRPTTDNWGLLGHEWAVDMLRQQLTRDSVRHAYLFTGPSGVGRRSLALRFSQALDCPNPPAPGEACRKCKTCQQIEQMQYADLTVIHTETEGKILRIEPVRDLLHSLALTPYQSLYKILIFLRFQEASPGTANILLKSLEEGPAHAIFILTADSAEQILPTILSRCEVLRLRPLPTGAVETYLKERGAEAASAHLLAHISGGRPGYALRLMQDKEALDFRQRRLAEIQNLLKSNRRERFSYAEKLTNRKYEAKEHFRETLLLWTSFWRDVLLRAAGSDTALTNVDYSGAVDRLAARLTLPEVRKLVSDAEEAIDKLERNVNARLLAEVTLLDWPTM